MRILLDVSRHSGQFALKPLYVGGGSIGGGGWVNNRPALWGRRSGNSGSGILEGGFEKKKKARGQQEGIKRDETQYKSCNVQKPSVIIEFQMMNRDLQMECPARAGQEWSEPVFPLPKSFGDVQSASATAKCPVV